MSKATKPTCDALEHKGGDNASTDSNSFHL